MKNIMLIDDQKAHIQYDPEINMFRGEFIGLNGGADFYANNIPSLMKEGKLSLKVFLEMCEEDKVEPYKRFSGKFNLRINPELHAKINTSALANGKSINTWITETLRNALL